MVQFENGRKMVAIATLQRQLRPVVLTLAVCAGLTVAQAAWAETPLARMGAVQGTSSTATRQEALQAIPFEKLDTAARNKVKTVLSNVTIFRRLPVRVVDCDPELYLFLLRHPDVVVNTWEALKLTHLQLRQTGPDQFRAVEQDGTVVTMEFLYKSHDTHVIYAEGTYTGALIQRQVHGTCLAVLKSGYVRETDGRYYETSRMDAFLNVEPGAVEIVTKTLQPLAVKVADNNFIQSIAFLGSLSRTAEVSPRSVQRLAAHLNVQPEVREEFASLATKIGARADAAVPTTSDDSGVRLAEPPPSRPQR